MTRFAPLALLCLAGLAFAAPANERALRKKDELQDLQGRIETLRRDLAKTEESHHSAADQLRETELAISAANRRLHELAAQRGAVEAQLADLDAQSQRLDKQSASQQRQLGRLLNRQFVGGDADALQLMLAGRDPNQAARDRHFLTLLSQAKADLIQQLQAAAAEKKRLAEAARERRAELADIERHQQEGRAQLLDKQRQRQATLTKIADRIKAQKREFGALKRDETRLSRLIEGLSRIAPSRKSKAPAASQEVKPTPAPTPGKSYDPGRVGGSFAALRGHLRLPLKGDLAARFGTPRAEGGATWKGLFIRAAEGSEVRAVAPGTVVFSDWLRGFGNLLIVDHGDDFLSVYGNNQSLLAGVGNAVRSGDVIATAGSSGGNAESGLYFELRHRGQAFDPLKWAGNR